MYDSSTDSVYDNMYPIINTFFKFREQKAYLITVTLINSFKINLSLENVLILTEYTYVHQSNSCLQIVSKFDSVENRCFIYQWPRPFDRDDVFHILRIEIGMKNTSMISMTSPLTSEYEIFTKYFYLF